MFGKSAWIFSNHWENFRECSLAAHVHTALRRLEAGNFGNSKALMEGVSELRIDFGPGYRIYYGMEGKTLIILLAGGTKRRQQRDIGTALMRWRRYKQHKTVT